jgi:hypothetical protein
LESEYSENKNFIGICGIEVAEEIAIMPGLIIRPVSLAIDQRIILIKDGKAILPLQVGVKPTQFEVTAELELDRELCDLKLVTDPYAIPIWFERIIRLRCGQTYVGAILCPTTLRVPENINSVGMLRAPDEGLLLRSARKVRVEKQIFEWVARHLKEAIELGSKEPLFELICSAIDEGYDHRNPSSALIFLVGVMEQIFAPDNRSESRFRTSALIASYLEPPGENRELFFKKVKIIYDWRSDAAHGRDSKDLDHVHEAWATLIAIAMKMLLERGVPKPEECMRMMLLGQGDYREISNDYELLPEGVHQPRRPDMKNLTDQQLLEKAEEFLKIAESRYGSRNPEWRLRAVLRNMEPSPYTAFFDKECEIWIGEPQTDSDYLWEIGQEVIHCLYPHDPERITKLEEGISMTFGMDLAGSRYIDGEYAEAHEHAVGLLKQHPDCIRNIRQKNNCSISAISFDMLREEVPNYPELELKLLTDYFSYGRSQSELDALKSSS